MITFSIHLLELFMALIVLIIVYHAINPYKRNQVKNFFIMIIWRYTDPRIDFTFNEILEKNGVKFKTLANDNHFTNGLIIYNRGNELYFTTEELFSNQPRFRTKEDLMAAKLLCL